MPTALFLSPHLDDAVFSCAGMIQQIIAAGNTVVVASVFTTGSSSHEGRWAEDLAAAAQLGFQTRHLHVLDAPFRSPAYQSFSDILYGWHEADKATSQAVVAHFQALEEDYQPSKVFAPLAAGTHVDHRIVHQAARELGWADRVCFYEDRPYAYARGAVERRLSALGVADAAADAAVLMDDHRQLPFVRRYLPKGAEALKCEKLLLAPPAIPAVPHNALSTQVECDADACHRAAQCYTSQYPAFCGDAREHSLLDRRHSHHVGSTASRCERYWTLHPALS